MPKASVLGFLTECWNPWLFRTLFSGTSPSQLIVFPFSDAILKKKKIQPDFVLMLESTKGSEGLRFLLKLVVVVQCLSALWLEKKVRDVGRNSGYKLDLGSDSAMLMIYLYSIAGVNTAGELTWGQRCCVDLMSSEEARFEVLLVTG